MHHPRWRSLKLCGLEKAWKNNPEKLGNHRGKTTAKWIHVLRAQNSEHKCPKCSRLLVKYTRFNSAPLFVAFITHDVKVRVDNQIVFPEIDQMYRLCGIVYYPPQMDQKHFVCRFVDKSGGVWFHDGAVYGEHVLYYGNIINFPYQKLQVVNKEYEMRMVIYTKL